MDKVGLLKVMTKAALWRWWLLPKQWKHTHTALIQSAISCYFTLDKSWHLYSECLKLFGGQCHLSKINSIIWGCSDSKIVAFETISGTVKETIFQSVEIASPHYLFMTRPQTCLSILI